MKFQHFAIRVTAITIGLLALFLFKPSSAISQMTPMPWHSSQEPIYKISNDFGVVIESEEQNILEGHFVVRKNKNWMPFEAQTVPRAIPANP